MEAILLHLHSRQQPAQSNTTPPKTITAIVKFMFSYIRAADSTLWQPFRLWLCCNAGLHHQILSVCLSFSSYTLQYTYKYCILEIKALQHHVGLNYFLKAYFINHIENYLVLKLSDVPEDFLKPQMVSSNHLFCWTNTPKPKDTEFIITYDKEN